MFRFVDHLLLRLGSFNEKIIFNIFIFIFGNNNIWGRYGKKKNDYDRFRWGIEYV